ncbi:hypothetical protein [Streptomyces sp. KR55]|uniref:hypothetical protein n=1 Tax=Streptomyces sp. KR55 TaxID=3457425 RepID=UPI003FD34829
MTDRRDPDAYGPHSPDYGLSYDPDPWADPEPIDDPDAWESDFQEGDPNDDHEEGLWEQAFREGWITREQFAQRRHGPNSPKPEAADPEPALRKAVEKLQDELANGRLSDDERDPKGADPRLADADARTDRVARRARDAVGGREHELTVCRRVSSCR